MTNSRTCREPGTREFRLRIGPIANGLVTPDTGPQNGKDCILPKIAEFAFEHEIRRNRTTSSFTAPIPAASVTSIEQPRTDADHREACGRCHRERKEKTCAQGEIDFRGNNHSLLPCCSRSIRFSNRETFRFRCSRPLMHRIVPFIAGRSSDEIQSFPRSNS